MNDLVAVIAAGGIVLLLIYNHIYPHRGGGRHDR